MLRLIYLLIGFLALGIGVLGIFLPIVPTTPLLLVSLWCFTRSSDKWRQWLLTNKYFGQLLNDYFSGKGISHKTRIVALVSLWGTLILCTVLNDSIYLRILFITIATGVTIHLCRLKTRE